MNEMTNCNSSPILPNPSPCGFSSAVRCYHLTLPVLLCLLLSGFLFHFKYHCMSAPDQQLQEGKDCLFWSLLHARTDAQRFSHLLPFPPGPQDYLIDLIGLNDS